MAASILKKMRTKQYENFVNPTYGQTACTVNKKEYKLLEKEKSTLKLTQLKSDAYCTQPIIPLHYAVASIDNRQNYILIIWVYFLLSTPSSRVEILFL
jgi:hypothetical protein